MMIGLIEGSINCSCKVAGNIGRLVTNLMYAAASISWNLKASSQPKQVMTKLMVAAVESQLA